MVPRGGDGAAVGPVAGAGAAGPSDQPHKDYHGVPLLVVVSSGDECSGKCSVECCSVECCSVGVEWSCFSRSSPRLCRYGIAYLLYDGLSAVCTFVFLIVQRESRKKILSFFLQNHVHGDS